jgi:hypothetical protein
MASQETIKQEVLRWSAARTRWTWTEQTVILYLDLFSDVPDELFSKASRLATLEPDFWPSPGKINAKLRELRHELSDHPTPSEAWDLVLGEISRHGVYEAPYFYDPLIKQAVDGVGWRDICLSDVPGVVRAHFLKAYEALLEREQWRQDLDPQTRAWLESGKRARHELPAGPRIERETSSERLEERGENGEEPNE